MNSHPTTSGSRPRGSRGFAIGTRLTRFAAPVGLGFLIVGPAFVAPPGWSAGPGGKDAVGFYNEGTRLLAAGRHREAEGMLQRAIGTGDERVLPVALYNLGLVRFEAGARAWAESPAPDGLREPVRTARELVAEALRRADEALAGSAATPLVAARGRLRSARRVLRRAVESVERSMAAHDAIGERWRRAAADFRGVLELRPGHADAAANVERMDRPLATVAGRRETLRGFLSALEADRRALEARLAALEDRLPRDHPRDSQGDDDEAEPDESTARRRDPTPSSDPGGPDQELALTPEEALRLLGSLRLEANRQLPAGDPRAASPASRPGRDW